MGTSLNEYTPTLKPLKLETKREREREREREKRETRNEQTNDILLKNTIGEVTTFRGLASLIYTFRGGDRVFHGGHLHR